MATVRTENIDVVAIPQYIIPINAVSTPMVVIKDPDGNVCAVELNANSLPVSFMCLVWHNRSCLKLVVCIKEPVGNILSGNILIKHRSTRIDRIAGNTLYPLANGIGIVLI